MAVRKYDYHEMAVSLFEELARHPKGITMEEIKDFLGVDRHVASKTITTLRVALGEEDTVTVPVIVENGKWIYKIDSTLEGSRPWLEYRAKYKAETIKTDVGSLRALVRALDGRSINGRAARQLLTSLSRLEEDLTSYLEVTA